MLWIMTILLALAVAVLVYRVRLGRWPWGRAADRRRTKEGPWKD